MNKPAAEKVLSASTLVAFTVNIDLYSFSIFSLLVNVISKHFNSLLILVFIRHKDDVEPPPHFNTFEQVTHYASSLFFLLKWHHTLNLLFLGIKYEG